MHTCFRACKDSTKDNINTGFIVDERDECDANSDKSLYCLEPSFPCENM